MRSSRLCRERQHAVAVGSRAPAPAAWLPGRSARSSAICIAVAGLCLVAAACGSSPTAPSGSPSAGSSGAVTTAHNKAVGAPIVVGLDSLEGGAVSLPYLRIGAQTAADYINAHLDGVHGRPIDYVVCDVDGTPQASIACGNKFVSDHVVAVLNTYDTSADSMLPILKSAGIPMFGHAAFGPVQQEASSDARFFGTANPAYSTGFLLYYKSLGFKNILLYEADIAFYHEQVASILQPIAKGLGLHVTVVYYNSTSPDWPTLAAEAASSNPQVAGTAAAPDLDCVNLLTALKQAGYTGRIFLGSCTLFLTSDKQYAPGVETTADLWKITDIGAAPVAAQAQLRTYEQAMTAAGQAQYIPTFAQDYFSDTFDFAAVLATIHGSVTPASVSAALKAFKGQSFMGQQLNCAAAWPDQSACGDEVLMYQVAPDGRQVPLTKTWISTSSVLKYLK